MKLKTGTSGPKVVAVAPWYEQAGALGLGTVGLAALAILTGMGVIVLAMLGPIWPPFDIAAHLAWHAFGALSGGIIGLFLVWRQRPWLAFLSLPLVAVLTVATPATIATLSTLERAQLATPPGTRTIRLVSLNTWHSNFEVDRLAAFLEKVRADVVILAEFGPPKARILRRLSASYPYQAGCARNWHCAMQLLSRHPFQSADTLSRDEGTGPPTVMAQFGKQFDGLKIIGVHLMRPIDSYLGSYREVKHIAQLAREYAAGPVVVAGDFNLTNWSSNWRAFRRASRLRHMGRLLPSWPASPRGWPQLPIDHAFASPELTFEQVGLAPSVGSDHLPLVVDIRLPDRRQDELSVKSCCSAFHVRNASVPR